MAGFQLSINGRFWVSTEGLREQALTEPVPSTTGFDERLSVTELRQPPLFVAAPLAASAVSASEADNQGGKALRRRAGLPLKCRKNLIPLWRALYAEPTAMTLFKRGVSDLGCGRGHDRRCGQISWSLTPQDCCGGRSGSSASRWAAQNAARGGGAATRTTICSCWMRSQRARRIR